MTDTMQVWNALSKTDPRHTKGFKRAGGFSGTAIKPIYNSQRMTEMFGPCGIGWGMGEPAFQVLPVGQEVLVYCTVSLWYLHEDKRGTVYGVGGDKVVSASRDGSVRTDDEAFKKAYTDAIGNAQKQIGMSADVHMGRFDDAKYVNDVAQEIQAEEEKKQAKARQTAVDALKMGIDMCSNLAALGQFWKENVAAVNGLSASEKHEVVSHKDLRKASLTPAVVAAE